MGWRFRKSIGGKYFRVNIGKKGITSATFGKRGAPHVTVGKNGTRVGSSIPGTGIYYTQKVGGTKPHRADTAQLPVVNAEPMQAQTAVLPPSMPPSNPIPPSQFSNGNGRHRLPWSKLVIASIAFGLLGLPFAPFRATAQFGQMMASIALVLGIAGLVVIVRKKSRRSLATAIVAIVLSLITGITATNSMPAELAPKPQSTASSSSASAEASKSAEAKRKAAAALRTDQDSLSSKVVDAKALLDSSDNNVADPNTRQALNDAIVKASAIDSTKPDDYAAAASDVQSAMDAVTASVEKKKQDDAAAAQQAEAEKKAAEESAAQKAAADKAAADAAAQQQAQQAAQQQAGQGSAYYPNCAAVRAAGKAPLHRGDPGYSSKLDRDGDGIACE
ncbi:MAG: DUF4236 domain-containing protein [Bifidobacterium tibiigranuli]|jgi:hypothetical protein|uniref:DUF4236 domain-containing protein n=1 Tax=Bifidobacterium tibiigranuli TaxID=2172043 RepID=UPI0023576C76|nr:DUF4236 domain-containing protein [Bifidobacterium tibiigranuli]MCH3975029.1 DUF4236 domain-containing protein [Bifidobacterium tibiigranuli]MCH4202789.1 DUF4236 domain-containing protein [Bifidobacterium tibiigranuli]MCH4274959.1 DUF4236 domain-containing protein [Bifidobacterium tibiigranuli]